MSKFSDRFRYMMGGNIDPLVEDILLNEKASQALVDRIFGYKAIKGDANSASYGSYDWYSDFLKISHERLTRYADYAEMAEYADIASFLDVISDDVTQIDRLHERTMWIESDNPKVEDIANDLLDRLHIEDLMWGIARQVATYGDCFFDIRLEDTNIVHLAYIDPKLVTKITDKDRQVQGYRIAMGQVASEAGTEAPNREPFEILHMMVTGKYINASYGDSFLSAARLIWKQLKMAEDAVLMYRLRRSSDRLVFSIPVGNSAPEEAMDIIERWKKFNQKRRFIDTNSQKLTSRYNPIATDEDIYLPIRQDFQPKIDKLPGSANIGEIMDIEYLRDKLYGALKIPKAYMAQEEVGGLNGRASLTQQDVRYARTVKRLQRAIILGIRRLIDVQLAYKGIDPTREENDYNVKTSVISNLDELQMADVLKTKMEVAKQIADVGQGLGLDKEDLIMFIVKDLLILPDDIIRKFMEPAEEEEQAASEMGSATAAPSGGEETLAPEGEEGEEGGEEEPTPPAESTKPDVNKLLVETIKTAQARFGRRSKYNDKLPTKFLGK